MELGVLRQSLQPLSNFNDAGRNEINAMNSIPHPNVTFSSNLD